MARSRVRTGGRPCSAKGRVGSPEFLPSSGHKTGEKGTVGSRPLGWTEEVAAQTRGGAPGTELPAVGGGGGSGGGWPGRRPDGAHRVNPRRAGARFPGQRRQFRRAGSYHRARAGERGGRGRGGAESSGSGPDAPGAAAARPGSAPRARSVPAGAAPRADAGAERAPARSPPAGAAECGRPAGSFEKRARTKAAAASRRPARARSPARAAPEDAAGGAAAAAAGRRGPGAAELSPARAGLRGRPPGM
ncbi:spidroin-2-like [Delphinus delphis]|uniref:spidroin-2-like n=1 Tax=Delphinus delphis TaxID=9728 RepID=UPI003750B71C